MNELQLALLAAGVVAVLAVWIYNVLQERKHRKLAEAIFKGNQDDVLVGSAGGANSFAAGNASADLAGSRREPGIAVAADPLSDAAAYSAPESPPWDETIETLEATELADPLTLPGADQAVPTTTNASASTASTETEAASNVVVQNAIGPDDLLPWVDPLVDCVVSFALTAPVTAAGLWAAQGSWKGGVGKPINSLARGNERGPWVHVDEGSADRFNQWMVGLQLVHRSGPVSDAGLARFLDGLQQIARHTGVEIALPMRSDMLLRAQDLDRFCASVDVQFSLSVVSAQGGAFIGTKLRGVCEAAGLTLDSDGLYHYRNAAGEDEFTLGNLGNEAFDATAMSSLATHGVSLTIDVPRVSDGVAAFNRMVMVARQLAQGLGGTLVDANRVALSDSVIGTIRAKIGELQQVLNQSGIVPGSARALRLFS